MVAKVVGGVLEGLRRVPPPKYHLSPTTPPRPLQASEGDAAVEKLQARLDASTAELEALATELHESEQAVLARDQLLREAEEAAGEAKERVSRARGEAEVEARRAGVAEELAAVEGGRVRVGLG